MQSGELCLKKGWEPGVWLPAQGPGFNSQQQKKKMQTILAHHLPKKTGGAGLPAFLRNAEAAPLKFLYQS